jgi:hypothetical protein
VEALPGAGASQDTPKSEGLGNSTGEDVQRQEAVYPRSVESETFARSYAPIELDPEEITDGLESTREANSELAALLVGLRAQVERPPQGHDLGKAAIESAITAREHRLGVKFPPEIWQMYLFADGFNLFHTNGDRPSFRMVPLKELNTAAGREGRRLRAAMKDWRADNVGYADPSRLRMFDVGRRDFISCSTEVDPGHVVWLRDPWSAERGQAGHEPTQVVTSSLVALLRYVLAPGRIRDGGWWDGEPWEVE